MNLYTRFAIITGASSAGLLVLMLLGLNRLRHSSEVVNKVVNEDFMPIVDQNMPEIDRINDGLALFLNADRDAYQAALARKEASAAMTQEELSAALATMEENLGQVAERMDKGIDSTGLDGEAVEAYRSNSKEWFAATDAIKKEIQAAFGSESLRRQVAAKTAAGFQPLRDQLDSMETAVSNSIDRSSSGADQHSLYVASQFLLGADRDLYQVRAGLESLDSAASVESLREIISAIRDNLQQVQFGVSQAGVVAPSAIDASSAQFLADLEPWADQVNRICDLVDSTFETELQLTAQQKIAAQLFSATRESIDNLSAVLEERLPKQREEMKAAVDTAVAENDAMQKILRSEIFVFLGVGLLSIVLVSGLVVFTARRILKVLKGTIEELGGASSQVSDASGQLANAGTDLARSSSEQAASIESSMSSLEELSATTKQNAISARDARDAVAASRDANDRGRESMNTVLNTMERIQLASQQTAQIIKTIDEIAFQTNILALNAAVEAARAGDAGRGFAVVAEEVRNLAQRSAEAARNTTELLSSSQSSTEAAVSATSQLQHILDEMSSSVTRVAEMIDHVSVASEEQTVGIDRIAGTVQEVDQIGQSTAASAEETASASEELASQAACLVDIVNNLSAFISGKRVAGHTPEGSDRFLSFDGDDSAPAEPHKGRLPTLTAGGRHTQKQEHVSLFE